MSSAYDRETLSEAVAVSASWADLMRRLGCAASGGRRRTLQSRVREHGIDTRHFKSQSPWRKYPDALIAEAVASSTTLRQVLDKLGAKPATGTLSHIRRRIQAADINVDHFPALNRPCLDLPFTREELREAAAASTSLRSAARLLGIPDDGRSRAALRRMLAEHGVNVSHFSHSRKSLPDERLRSAVAESTSYAEVMRRLGLVVNDANQRHIQRRTARLGYDTSHFVRTARRSIPPARARTAASAVLRIQPSGSGRLRHARLRRALDEVGVRYACAGCGNTGQWQGVAMTLHIDHVNGDWRDNRLENLRYLCPNCHTITDTWCGRNRAGARGRPSRDTLPPPLVGRYDSGDRRP